MAKDHVARAIPVSFMVATLLTQWACAPKQTRPQPPRPTPAAVATPTPAPAAQPSPTPWLVTKPALVPLPASLSFPEGVEAFQVTPGMSIIVQADDPRAHFVARFVARLFATVGGSGPAVIAGDLIDGRGNITLRLDRSRADLGDEGYALSVTPDAIRIQASTAAGLFYGVQTLRQMLPPLVEYEAVRPQRIAIAVAEISDAPRFTWRGTMLDVARHFFGVDDVKRHIDLMALHKMNRLHLHLSDDQGFRIEIKSRPKLTEIGALTEVGGGPGGFYTQKDYAEIVAYAAERFITVVPEIDIPGHTNAALASYPELNCDGVAPPLYTDIRVGFSVVCVTDERTYAFLDDVIREISALTPGDWFHIGGDEVKKLGPADYAAFIERAQGLVLRHGKRVIGWDEVAHAKLDETTIIQHWRPGVDLSAAPSGVRFIMSPANRTYLDMQYDTATPIGLSWAGRIEVKDSYSWDPATLLPNVQETRVLGVEGPLWSETTAEMRDIEALAFPRLASLAEVAWTPQRARVFEDFRVRLGAQAPRWQALGINFYRSPQIPWK